MTCTATLTTATVKPCPENGLHTRHPLGGFCVGQQHITLHELTCKRHDPDHISEDTGHWCKTGNNTNDYTEWRDSTPGATPHADPLVTEAEVDAACEAFAWSAGHGLGSAIRAALEAAAEARTP